MPVWMEAWIAGSMWRRALQDVNSGFCVLPSQCNQVHCTWVAYQPQQTGSATGCLGTLDINCVSVHGGRKWGIGLEQVDNGTWCAWAHASIGRDVACTSSVNSAIAMPPWKRLRRLNPSRRVGMAHAQCMARPGCLRNQITWTRPCRGPVCQPSGPPP